MLSSELELPLHRTADCGREPAKETNAHGGRGRANHHESQRPLPGAVRSAGRRVGEGLGLRVEHLTDDFSTVNITQSAWRGKTQSPKTANAVRKIDLHSSLSAMLKTFVNGRVEGFLFSSASGRPLTQRNVLRSGFGKIRKPSVWIRMAWAFMPSVVSAQHT